MNLEEMKEKLRNAENITFTVHYYEPKVQIRGITEAEITSQIKNPEKLVSFMDKVNILKGTNMLFCSRNQTNMTSE